MAATVEGTFKLIDKASGTLDKIWRKAAAADKAVEALGTKLDKLDGQMAAASGEADKLSQNLDKISRMKATPKVELKGVPAALAGLKAVQHELDVTDRKARTSGGGGGLFSRFFGRLPTFGSSNLMAAFGDLANKGDRLTQRLRPLGRALGAVGAGFSGVAKALPMMAWGVIALTPLVISLAGGITALAASLTAAVGGGAAVGATGLAAFAFGIGTIASVIKPAMTDLKNYDKAVKSLNKAMASGNPKAIQTAQQHVNQLAKQAPGVAKLSRELHGISGTWKTLTKPARQVFFTIASEAVHRLRSNMKLFASETNKNMGALHTALKPIFGKGGLFDTPLFRSFIRTMGTTFRSLIKDIGPGLKSLGQAFFRIAQYFAPFVRSLGHGFRDLMDRFDKWAQNKGNLKLLLDSFKTWWEMLKAIVRLLATITKTGARPGNTLVGDLTKWLDKQNAAIKKHPEGLMHWFTKGAGDLKSTVGAIVNLARAIVGITKALPGLLGPVSALSKFFGDNPAVAQIILGGYLGFKGAKGINKFLGKGPSSGGPQASGAKGILGRILGSGQIEGFFGPSRPGSKLNPIHVTGGGGGPGGPGGGKQPKGGQPTPIWKRALNKVGGPAAVTGGGTALGTGAETAAALGSAGGLEAAATALGPIGVILGLALTNNHNFKKADVNRQSAARATYMNRTHGQPIGGLGPLGVGGTRLTPAQMGREGGAGLAAATAAGATKIGSNIGAGLAQASKLFDSHGKHINRVWTDLMKSLPDTANKKLSDTEKGVHTQLATVKGHFTDALTAMFKTTTTIFGQIYNEMTGDLKKIGGGVTSGTGAVTAGVTAASNFVTGTTQPTTTAKKKKARGGRIPGAGVLDTVPVAPGQMAAPGELIVNRHTERKIDRMIGRVGALDNAVRNEGTPHSAPPDTMIPTGTRIDSGIMPGLAHGGRRRRTGNPGAKSGGGLFTNVAIGALANQGARGAGGSFSAMVQEANAIDAQHYPYRWGGGHNSGFTGPYDCSGAVSAVLHAGGVLGSPLVSGSFMSFGSPGPGDVTLYANPHHVYMSMGGKFWGTSGANPGGGAGWFAGGPRPGFTVRNVPVTGGGALGPVGMGGAAPQLKNRKVGGSGLMHVLGQTAVNRVRGAAQAKLNAAAPGGGGGIPSVGGGAWQSALQQIAQAKGWNAADWMWIVQHESGGNPNIRNPGSGAYGLGQFLGSTLQAYAKWGASSSDPVKQIEAMAHYIADRYQNPTAAKSFWQGHNWYEKGGRVPGDVPFGGWHGGGADMMVNRPTYIGVGDGGPEHVQITPRGKGHGVHVQKLVVYGNDETKAKVKAAFHELASELDLQGVEVDDG